MSRPFVLDPLFRPLTTLSGIGPKNAKFLEKLVGGPKLLDLLWHFPIEVIDRRFAPTVSGAPHGTVATLTVTIGKHFPNQKKGQPYKIWCHDATGTLHLVFFHVHGDWLTKQFPEGSTRIVSGKVEYYNGHPQITHPESALPEDRASLETLEPVYPLTQGLTNKTVRKAIGHALEALPVLSEWLDPAHKARERWSAWHDSLRTLQNILEPEALRSDHPARLRLAYDELLANQLTLTLVRHRQKKNAGRIYQGDGRLRKILTETLPFSLTNAQKQALREIETDMATPARMLRLLQGDVGSGKTIVAALAMFNAIESGAQAAIMAPTEILARQHADSFKPWLEATGIKAVTLTGRDKGKARTTLLAQIADGSAQIVIGTHALFQDDISFHNLGLAVIDEQHRFGVHQRLQLSGKGKGVDILVMTATPIPRTLTLTAYGDMDVSLLREKPPGRKPVETRLIPQEKLEDMIAGLQRQIATGARIYWVCPLVEESEIIDLSAAEARYDILKDIFGPRVGLVHGRMKPSEKDEVMTRFAAGALDILVATTVIEVGVNVPEATIMVIEHAERFGLAQLHQLRGRVGRGGEKSWCFLLYSAPLGETAKERLSVMRETEDGFVIAEKDLALRGAGDILGVKQSGLPLFHIADLAVHGDLLATARDDARLIMDKDPALQTERGQALRTLLYLFERDQAISYLRSG